ncbi:acyl-CoA thioesterase [Bacillus sp. FJAT-45350]|uniref:acyl-CoA thioesterase n=1 Tax=Bacillus sp. FJAT-45350 TaxID=2011014 RepID=UPI000BB70396|nr:thioesterase family protein [Bacillus sp. FJAT-45350]
MVENTLTYRVTWGDTDMAGIVYYPNYFKWFDTGSQTLLQLIGLPPKDMMVNEKIAHPIIDTNGTFKLPLYYFDEIKIVTRIAEVNDKVFRMEHELYRGDDLTGKGYEIKGWVHFSKDGKLKAHTIPKYARDKLLGVTSTVKE